MWRRDKFKFPPGPYRGLKGWSFRALRQNPLEMFSELARCGDIVGIRVVNFRNIFVNHPDLIEEVLVGHPRRYIKGRVLRANRHVFGEGLLTSEGDFWLRQRRLVQPGFHRARIAAYAVTMVQYAQRMLEGWRDGEERDVHQEMIRLTLQIVAKTLFDADVAGDARDVGKSLELLLELGADFRRTLFVPHWVPTPTNLRIKREIAFIEGILHRIISERRACGRDTGDLLSMLLHAQDEDGSRMTDQQLRDEAITLFLAGHETTASSLSWTWWLLAQNPAAEAKLHAELDEVLVGRAPSIDDLARLPRFAYFPFGGGPRQCIGNSFALMEARLILATIAQKYRLHLVPDHPVVPLASITLRPRYGVRVVLESRQPRVIRNLSQTSQTTAQTLSAD